MEEPIQTALADIERRLTALEARQGSEGGAKEKPEAWWFLGPLVPIAVFAWLSGSSMAWIAVGIIGFAAVLASAAVAMRRV
jgi:hypothetical protein